MHSALLSCILLYYHAFCSIIMYSALLSCILLYYHAFCSIIMYSALLSCILLYYHVFCSSTVSTCLELSFTTSPLFPLCPAPPGSAGVFPLRNLFGILTLAATISCP